TNPILRSSSISPFLLGITPSAIVYKEPEYDPLLAIHRIENLEITDMSFKAPDNFDFEKVYNQTFGVMKKDAFQLKIEFSGYAAKHVRERIWSHDQIIEDKSDDKLKLTFGWSSYKFPRLFLLKNYNLASLI
ncbi:MAG: WYL domain-containing protein, partial [Desulfamplus sp.]|nr:WYL domain-containing protein [Desulfamplus sp.]